MCRRFGGSGEHSAELTTLVKRIRYRRGGGRDGRPWVLRAWGRQNGAATDRWITAAERASAPSRRRLRASAPKPIKLYDRNIDPSPRQRARVQCAAKIDAPTRALGHWRRRRRRLYPPPNWHVLNFDSAACTRRYVQRPRRRSGEDAAVGRTGMFESGTQTEKKGIRNKILQHRVMDSSGRSEKILLGE